MLSIACVALLSHGMKRVQQGNEEQPKEDE